ncbi:MAG: response regulator [Terrimicrobiaceae bacterium]|nr:response regulator [Terrimicrobiaceae bacterium]
MTGGSVGLAWLLIGGLAVAVVAAMIFWYRERERRQGLEEAAAERRALLAEHETDRQFREALLAALPVAVFYKDAQGRFLGCNETFTRLVGVTEESIRGRLVTEVWSGPAYEGHHRRDLGLLASGGRESYEGVVMDVEGRERSVIFNKSVFRDEAGRVAGLVGCFIDISEHKRMEQALREAMVRAEEGNRAKSAFLAAMSHEIRTPLNGVVGFASLLLDTPLRADQKDYAESVRNSAEALLSIVNDILDFSKIEAGRIDLEEVSFDLREALESCMDLVLPAATRRDLELCLWVDESCPEYVIGDATRFRQVLTNLLSNAVKFTEHGEIEVRAEARRDRLGGGSFLRVMVRDTGIGLSVAQQEMIFAPFTQADASTTRRFGGTGLGLTICRRLLDAMGGTISVDSSPGLGSTFTFEIPLRADLAGASIGSGSRLDGLSVAIVDDHDTNRVYLERQLVGWGARPRAFSSPLDFLACLQAGYIPDAVLMDFHMPEIDGTEAARRIRALRGLDELPIILLSSGNVSTRELPAGLFLRVFTKPVNARQLRSCLAGLRDPGLLDAAENPVLIDTRSTRVLLVEDNASNQRLGAMMLGKLGYRAEVAANGMEAVDMVNAAGFDIIFMDIQMPEMDGLDATREIRRSVPLSAQPWIVALTAHAAETDRERCLAAGMDDYLTKPLRRENLVAVLKRAELALAGRRRLV